MRYIILLLILVLCKSQKINYIDLAIKKCENNQISIHGLWGEYNQHSYPSFCNISKFNESKIDNLIGDMNENWYPCESWHLSKLYFWKHEYYKHFSCIFDQNKNYTMYNYFRNGLKAFKIAKSNNWFNCCDMDKYNQCLIPFSTDINIKWLGYCH